MLSVSPSIESWEAHGEGSEHEEKELPLPVNPRRAQALPLLFHRKEEDDNGLMEEASYTYTDIWQINHQPS
jgi:hypothetical protein